jgi:hypothetical protein
LREAAPEINFATNCGGANQLRRSCVRIAGQISPFENHRTRLAGQEPLDNNPDRKSSVEQTELSLFGSTSRLQCNVFLRENMPLEPGHAHPSLVYDEFESG